MAEMTERFLRMRDVKARTGLGRSTIYAYIARGQFPRPVRIGTRTSGWVSSEIDRWMHHRIDLSRREGER
jgi:prophage regulatory protein